MWEELNSDYPDAVRFSATSWLSRAGTLKRFLNLQQEIKSFIESKHQDVSFLNNEERLNDLAFLTDIAQHLSELHVKLQRESQLVNKLFKHICAFEKGCTFSKLNFLILIVINMQALKGCIMSLQTDLQISKGMRRN